MKIQFERSGGFAGIPLTATIDTASLTPDVAKEVADLVQSARFFEIAAVIDSKGGADRFQYKVTVEDAGRSHTVETGEAAAPAALQPLLQRLAILARSR